MTSLLAVAGGGILKLTVSGIMAVEGTVTASGDNGVSYGGGGSGGSILVIVNNLEGSGVIKVRPQYHGRLM